MLTWSLRGIYLPDATIERHCTACVLNVEGNDNSIPFAYIFTTVLCKLIVLYKLIKNKNGIFNKHHVIFRIVNVKL